jgi:hypothetical protein
VLSLLSVLKLLGLPHNFVDDPGEGEVGVNVADERDKQHAELEGCL